MDQITLFVKYVPQATSGDWFDILFYNNPLCQGKPVEGKINVGMEGAKIVFMPVLSQMTNQEWRFHDVTIHPQGPDTDKLELRWQVNPMVVSILHSEAKIHRVYSYTLSLELCDKGKPTGTFVYLDPQIVDTGGGNK